jgi:teichuronic acid biosynthesis glycosyltransferase TuaH
VENGVDYGQFEAATEVELQGVPRPRLGFVGGLKFKIDFDLIGLVADRLPEVSIVLIGPIDASVKAAASGLRSRGNVHFLGGVGYGQVAGYVKALDAGLLPYVEMEYNHAVSPLKLFEYLASGIPAVGTGLPTTKKYAQEGIYYYAEQGGESFVELCRRALSQAGNPEYLRARQLLAETQDWNRKFAFMLKTALENV